MKFSTKVIHSGKKFYSKLRPILTPIYQTTTYVQESVEKYDATGYTYSRKKNPTRTALEDRINELEGGKGTCVFSMGMAAINITAQTLLEKGDHVIVSDVVYGGTPRLFSHIFKKFGVEFDYVDTAESQNVEEAIKENTRMVLTETPANPTLKLTDLKAVSSITKRNNLLHVVDNTFLTPYYQRPLELGADVVIHSTTKYLDGHSMTLGGAVVAGKKSIHEKLEFSQNATGSGLDPFQSWLTLVGIKTLPLRLDKQSENAMQIAKFLEKHSKVEWVIYPGLRSFPQYELAKKQASGFGGMLCFGLKGGIKSGKKFMDSVKLCSLAENLGSVETLITYPSVMTHAEIPKEERIKVGISDDLIRISVGIEDVEDIIEDLKQALKRA
jgi:cystathionine beta-lyase/cystathionine gamma-synthase